MGRAQQYIETGAAASTKAAVSAAERAKEAIASAADDAAAAADGTVAAHVAAPNPHPVYSLAGHGHAGTYDPAGTAATAVSALASALGTAAGVDVPASGDAAAGEAVLGSDTRLSDARAPTAHSHSGLVPAGGSFGQVLKKSSATDYDYAWAADATGGGAGGLSEASVAFTDGDTARRVTVTDAAVTPSSKVHVSIRRPDTADASQDRGYIFIPNVVRRAAGAFDAVIVCLGLSGEDPTLNPPNETVTLTYMVA